ncbi:hypothetical protein ABG79_00358 [Caloramator mitchellensis]|uniref:Uncharacterized protein n=1 Tax=Caloramator mitchellensis TaxID=908809 RepID=A0A0R3K3E1_CALMK|nr:hypothetical protein ABG79_00358 [Caloramator mitchellensis]
MKKIKICILLFLVLSWFTFNIAKIATMNYKRTFITSEEEPRVHSVKYLI